MVDLSFLKNLGFLGNTLDHYLYALLVFAGLYIGLALIRGVVLLRLEVVAKKTTNKYDDVVINALLKINWPFFFFVSLLSAIRYIKTIDLVDKIAFYLTVFVITIYVVRVLRVLIVQGSHAVNTRGDKIEEDYDDSLANVMATIIQALVWVGIFLFLLSNAGVDITTALAGVGVGGIAIAFALQNVLSDLFASFSIYFDKPFKKGDFLVIGTDSGIVQKIGLKSTRIKTLQGEELVVSNKELTETRINNFKKLERRRVVITIGVTYDTPVAKMKKIPDMVKKIMEKEKKATFDRAHFKEYADSSMNFEIVFYIESSEYLTYMDIRQRINLEILKIFNKEKINFAFPSRTIYLKK